MKLTKKTYISKDAEKFVDKYFKELKQNTEGVSLTNFFEIYNKLFLQIPKTGTLSHTTLFNKSGEYLQSAELSSDKVIRDLKNNIQSLNQQVADLEAEKNILEADNKVKEQEIRLLKEI